MCSPCVTYGLLAFFFCYCIFCVALLTLLLLLHRQFLEGVHAMTDNIVRLGSRSQSEVLKQRHLRELVFERKVRCICLFCLFLGELLSKLFWR